MTLCPPPCTLQGKHAPLHGPDLDASPLPLLRSLLRATTWLPPTFMSCGGRRAQLLGGEGRRKRGGWAGGGLGAARGGAGRGVGRSGGIRRPCNWGGLVDDDFSSAKVGWGVAGDTAGWPPGRSDPACV